MFYKNINSVAINIMASLKKEAISLGELLLNTSKRSQKYLRGVKARLYRSYPDRGRWEFRAEGSERWSKGPYTVIFQLLLGRGKKTVGLLGREVKVSCTCDAWKYLGADYNALTGGYSERQHSDGTPPNKKDRRRKFKICKHIGACAQLFKDFKIPEKFK